MPGGDGTGPAGPGRGRGRGFGPGFGGRRFGAPGKCRCPACGTEVPHTRGIPCTQMKCPKCGALMIRGD